MVTTGVVLSVFRAGALTALATGLGYLGEGLAAETWAVPTMLALGVVGDRSRDNRFARRARPEGMTNYGAIPPIDPATADAIGPAVEGEADYPNAVFTPDDNETETIERHYASLDAFSAETGAIVVSTGATDTVIEDGERWTNETGTPAMTVAGTGDVLTGIVASLLGQGLDRAEAAKLGTWIVGRAGERATHEYGNGLLATDIIEKIPAVMG